MRKENTLIEPTSSAKPQSTSPSSSRRQGVRQILGRVAALLFALGVTVAIAIFASQVDIQQLRRYGYLGVFLASLLANASIVLPLPGLAVTVGVAAALPNEWWLVALVAAVGEALGESTAYLAGYGGSAVIENRPIYQRLRYWMEHHGTMTIFVLSAVPNPLIDAAGITAGASKYAYYKFLLACWLGKTVKTLVFSWAGLHSADWLLQFL
jgi:membrane protein DedA with SNARE-associated domain